jgi:hypothetical protein
MHFPEIRALYSLGEDNYGVAEAEINTAEARLQAGIPAVLRTYYTELGAHNSLNHSQNNLLLPGELSYSKNITHLLFYADNQWECMWGIPVQDLSLPDPPVWVSYDEASLVAEPVWEPEAATLSSFLLAMAYQQALFAFPYTANAMNIGPEVAAHIRAFCSVLPVALPTWSVTYLQASSNQLLALMQSPQQTQYDLFVAATTETGFNTLSALLNVEWDYNSLTD